MIPKKCLLLDNYVNKNKHLNEYCTFTITLIKVKLLNNNYNTQSLFLWSNRGVRLSTLFKKLKKAPAGINLGISLETDRVSVCVTEPGPDGLVVSHCVTVQGTQSRAQLLKQLIEDHSIPKVPVNIALSVEDRRIYQIVRPKVDASEMCQSVIWLLKDRLDCSTEEALVEVVDYPTGCQLDDKIMVIQTTQKKVQQLVDVVTEAGLEIKSIDMTSLLMGDILQKYPGIEQGIALVLDHEEGATLIVYRGEYLYLIRKLSGIRDFISCLPVEGNVMKADQLLLEIQRTLDYYDAQMRQPPLARILLAPSFADISPLADYLNQNLAIPVECLDINQLLNLPEPLAPAEQQDCLPACAAAFRQESDR